MSVEEINTVRERNICGVNKSNRIATADSCPIRLRRKFLQLIEDISSFLEGEESNQKHLPMKARRAAERNIFYQLEVISGYLRMANTCWGGGGSSGRVWSCDVKLLCRACVMDRMDRRRSIFWRSVGQPVNRAPRTTTTPRTNGWEFPTTKVCVQN